MKIKVKEAVVRAWDYLQGKKTIIGVVLHTAWLAINIVKPDLCNTDKYFTGHAVIFNITGVGIGSKILKWAKKE